MIFAFLLAVGLQPPPDRVFHDDAEGKRASTQSQQSARVSAKAVSDFFRWAREREKGEVRDVWKKAVEVFPRGSTIEGYPDSVGDPTSRRSLSARSMVSGQLKRDGVNVEEVEAVTLFIGDNGQVQCDVVLVVSKVTRRIIGVYQGWYGR
jgi:hypothetical protein